MIIHLLVCLFIQPFDGAIGSSCAQELTRFDKDHYQVPNNNNNSNNNNNNNNNNNINVK